MRFDLTPAQRMITDAVREQAERVIYRTPRPQLGFNAELLDILDENQIAVARNRGYGSEQPKPNGKSGKRSSTNGQRSTGAAKAYKQAKDLNKHVGSEVQKQHGTRLREAEETYQDRIGEPNDMVEEHAERMEQRRIELLRLEGRNRKAENAHALEVRRLQLQQHLAQTAQQQEAARQTFALRGVLLAAFVSAPFAFKGHLSLAAGVFASAIFLLSCSIGRIDRRFFQRLFGVLSGLKGTGKGKNDEETKG